MNWKWTTIGLAVLSVALILFLFLKPADTNRVVVRDTVTQTVAERVVDTIPPDLSATRSEIREMRMVLPQSHHEPYHRALDDVLESLPEE